jgi:hypothetical protein
LNQCPTDRQIGFDDNAADFFQGEHDVVGNERNLKLTTTVPTTTPMMMMMPTNPHHADTVPLEAVAQLFHQKSSVFPSQRVVNPVPTGRLRQTSVVKSLVLPQAVLTKTSKRFLRGELVWTNPLRLYEAIFEAEGLSAVAFEVQETV